ncbi:hypothetical protein [Flavobacterium caeni]|uniref:Lipoprotein n=1 Tax=Flavobacterium caeni TaxID=490189 RepID=A0A1G5BRV8_9FLAO|nr:hypothetical protein [Flavobacterium caeni]SCX92826.1 hypothetical protein SAMN02927903_00456 [Flavobacterium caeni]
MRSKTILLIVIGLLVFSGCKSKKTATATPRTTVIEKEKIDEAQKSKAYEAGRRILMTCNTSKFKPFTTAEATPTVIKNTTQDRLTKTCLKFRLKYGDFRDIQLVEVIRNKSDKTNVYRFKALYEKKIANKELRVTMNDEDKVSGIKSLDWVDQY